MSFEHTLRQLSRIRLRAHAGLIALLVLTLGAWGVWLGKGTVSLYVRSQRARLEVEQNAYPVQAEVEGIVARCDLKLGRHVESGDLLVQLDVRTFELQLAEKRAVLEGRRLALEALLSRRDAEQRARAGVAALVDDTRRVAKDRVSVDERGAKYKGAEREMVERLHAEALASRMETLRVQSEQESMQRQLSLTRHQGKLDTQAALSTLRDREVVLATLETTIVEAQSDLDLQRAQLASLEYEVERRGIRARTAGQLSDVMGCTPGMTIRTTDRLATLLPDGEVRIVGYFAPQEAIGRIRQGDPVLVRVDNFPWAQFGVVRATVSEVGSEARDGQVRVEMRLASEQQNSIPISHGLVATAEVRTEQLAPGRLLFRLAGQAWQAPQVGPSSSRSDP